MANSKEWVSKKRPMKNRLEKAAANLPLGGRYLPSRPCRLNQVELIGLPRRSRTNRAYRIPSGAKVLRGERRFGAAAGSNTEASMTRCVASATRDKKS